MCRNFLPKGLFVELQSFPSMYNTTVWISIIPGQRKSFVYTTIKLPPSLQKLQEWRRYLPKQIKIRHGGKNNCMLHTDAPEILFFPLPPNILSFINENNRKMVIYG